MIPHIRFNPWRHLAPFFAAVVLLGVGPGQAALASSSYTSSGIGYDISFPQCTKDLGPPAMTSDGTSPQFGVVGVTHGRAFTQNTCLAGEYQAAVSLGVPVSFYFNVNAPRSLQDPEAQNGPKGPCNPGDDACAHYNYGWNATQAAYDYATQTLGALGTAGVPQTWWLDVETANYWAQDPSLNDQVIQGAIDFLQGVTSANLDKGTSAVTVGVYSIPTMWSRIAGADFQPGVPAWVVGPHQLGGGSRLCTDTSFTGGSVWLVQAVIAGTDWDYAC